MAQPGPSRSGQPPDDDDGPVQEIFKTPTVPDPDVIARQEEERNPVKKVGKKLKQAFVSRSRQQPSIRILRDPATGTKVAVPKHVVDDMQASGVPPTLPLRDGEAPSLLLRDGDADVGSTVAGGRTSSEYAEHFAAQARAHPDNAQSDNTQPDNAGGFGSRLKNMFSRGGNEGDHVHDEQHAPEPVNLDEYDADTVDLLDVVDPEVSTLSTLTNVQNSLFVPSLGNWVNRRATYRLSSRPGEARTIEKLKSILHVPPREDETDEKSGETEPQGMEDIEESPERPNLGRGDTITSTLSESRYAVLPPGESLAGWTHEEKLELDDMVRHMLHSRRARFKRTMKGFGQYVRRPLGLFITVYATLITLFGAAWVLFLIGWISIGSKRDYVINVVDNVLVALFAVIGDGLAPFRAVDTYHMIYIVYYHRKTWKRRRRMGLPNLVDPNDLPEQRKEDIEPMSYDVESLMVKKRIPKRLAGIIAPRLPNRLARRVVTRGSVADPSYEYSVLTEKEQATLEHHERKFSKSHTFYKPHETETHFAFPMKYLITVVLLLDMHSCLQISLGACTWGIPYKTRPFALTTVILCCSITCNIMGGVFISIGDRKTRKKEVIERMMRQELTSEAMDQMQEKWMKEAEEQGELDKSVRKRFEKEKDELENEEIKRAWMKVPSLPKRLLGKQKEDNRQTSLPQKAKSSSQQRRSPSQSRSRLHTTSSGGSGGSGGSGDDRKSGTFSPLRSKAKLPTLSEDQSAQTGPERVARTQAGGPSQPAPVAVPEGLRGENTKPPEKESTGQKVMRMIRRADLDVS